MYQTTKEMRQAQGFESLTQIQRKKFYELVYEINECLRDRDEQGRTIFARNYTKMKVYADKQECCSEEDVEVEITLENGETMNFRSNMFF